MTDNDETAEATIVTDGVGLEPTVFSERQLKEAERIAEALVFASAEPVSPGFIAERLPRGMDVDAVLQHLKAAYAGRGVDLGAVDLADDVARLETEAIGWRAAIDVDDGHAGEVGAKPEPLRKPIERILKGTDTTVSMTDAVARYGLDPGVVQTAVVVGTIADAVGTFRYTVLSGGHIAPAAAWVKAHIATEPVPILGNVTCNKLIFPQLRAALEDVMAQGLADRIHPGEYAGCYYPRFIAGTTTLSNHAFGLALDLNVPGNQRGTSGQMDRGVVAIFKHWGFTWGGDWKYTDPMHFEMNQLVTPK